MAKNTNYHDLTPEEKEAFIKRKVEELRGNAVKKLYENVRLSIPFANVIAKDELPKYALPENAQMIELEDSYIVSRTEEVNYVMTSDIKELRERFFKLGIPFPKSEDMRENTMLALVVREKMQELGVRWSMAFYNGSVILNYYYPKHEPRIYIHKLKEKN